MKALIKKYWDVLIYLVFGVLTTVVNYLVYVPLCELGWSGVASTVVAWVAAVAFAFVTNKPFVFRSHDWSPKTVFPELWKFLTCRIGSGVMDAGIIWITVDIIGWDKYWMKLVTSVLVVILNYFGSKILVFRKK